MRFLYTFVLWLLLPLVLIRLLLRARKQTAYLQHIPERFGFYTDTQKNKSYIWLHAVSVGETRACQALIQQLQTQYPQFSILLTHSTPTGRATSEQLFGNNVTRVYLPYDYPFAVKHFLKHFQPQLGILMETEIWCNLIHHGHQKNIPILLLNGRMSEKSMRGYNKLAKLTQQTLNKIQLIGAQTHDDAMRFQQLGAPQVEVMGNLKYDINPNKQQLMLGQIFLTRFGTERPKLLAASTREGEEALILEQFQNIKIPNLLLIIVPRHPQRFTEVSTLIQQHKLRYQTRSSEELIQADTQVVLGDSMGEMFAYYHAADLSIMGGSLLPFGGQNLIESCAVGTPVILGPYTYNFAQATQAACHAGAAFQLEHIDEIPSKVHQLLSETEQHQNMQLACKTFIKQNQGATQTALTLIHSALAVNNCCT